MTKNKILFVMESLRIGGAEKSLLTILSMFDYDRFDVDLLLFRHNGEFMPFLPSEVNLLPEDIVFQCFDRNRKKSPVEYAKKGMFGRAVHAAAYLAKVFLSRITRSSLYIGWKHQKHFFIPPTDSYDVAIAFLERRTIYYVADLINADKKIGFIHNDYSVYPYDEKEDMRCFNEFDWIAAVSEHCKDVLCEKFPMYTDKFTVIKNMVSRKLIREMSEEPILNFKKEPNTMYLVSVGRLTPQKGFDNAIEICSKLINEGQNVKWYIVGEGEQRQELEKKISENNLENNFILVGADVNPYRWMKMCDVYVQPSRFEGFGITVAEAKAMNKKIVAAHIPEFEELLGDYPNGITADYENFSKQILCFYKRDSVTSDPLIEENQIKNLYMLIEEKNER